jgi:fido (protein-threonine AMPylation protein)
LLYQSPRLDSHERAVIAAIDSIHEKLRGQVLLSAKWHGVTYREIFVRSLAEGVARMERAPRVPGYTRAMTYVLQRSDDPHFVYNAELLKALHFMINEEDRLAWPGKWRPRDAGVRDGDGEVIFRAPEAGQVVLLMEELTNWLNRKDPDPAIVRAALAMLNLLRIHAFRDGNGRVSRCLYSLVMGRAGYRAPAFVSIEEYIGHHREEYDRALDSAGGSHFEPMRDTRPWVRFCLTAHYRQALELLHRYEEFGRLCIELGADMAESGLETGASIAASELFATTAAEQVARWQQFDLGESESRANLNTEFHFSWDTIREDQSPAHSAQDRHSVALLDPALHIHGESITDPFTLLEELERGGQLHQPAA